MSTTTMTRCAIQAKSTARFCRYASSSASGSSSTTSSFKPSSSKPVRKPLPDSTLRDLVSLYHTTSTYMTSPDLMPRAFENAFSYPVKSNDIPQFGEMATGARQNLEARGPPGVESFLRRSASTSRGGEIEPGRQAPPAARNLRNVWAAKESWWSMGGAGAQNEHMSERERAVLETLYGTFDRMGMYDAVEPGLDGVREYVEAKETTIEQYAREWQEQAEQPEHPANKTSDSTSQEP